jgi:uncharacterized repeat protein (TIGR03803 family)
MNMKTRIEPEDLDGQPRMARMKRNCTTQNTETGKRDFEQEATQRTEIQREKSLFSSNPFLLPALIAALNSIPAGRVTAQTFTTVHTFTGNDGGAPIGLILSGNTLYGTAVGGGYWGGGTVFKVNADGTGFTNLHSFTGSDGTNPWAGLVLSGNTLYGTASGGGYWGGGTVFKVNADGKGFTNLHSFTGSEGTNPVAGLVLSGNTLYGTASGGGYRGGGTVFAINTDGTGFTTLHGFTRNLCNLNCRTVADCIPCGGVCVTDNGGHYCYWNNSDGANPQAGLALSGNTLYGTTYQGGSWDHGTVFALNTDGTGFTILHNFADTPYNNTNSDGAHPQAGLILSGDTLYGTANRGGSAGNGTVFAVKTDGTGFTTLHSFTATFPYITNSDGANPEAGLILSGNTLYGTASQGGTSGDGTVFALNTDGTGFTNLHSFTELPGISYGTNSDGIRPYAGLILSGNTLCGTAINGGSAGHGTLFSLSFRPQLTITFSGTNIILTWPTNVAGFDYTGYTLQSTTNLVSPAVSATNSPAPVIVNGLNTVTNPVSGPQQFFRLVQ